MSKKTNNEKEWLLFYILLNERGFHSELSGEPLEGTIHKDWFYFIYPKSKYPELRYCPTNIVLISDLERQVISDIIDHPIVIQKAAEIARNYNELVEETKIYSEGFLDPVLKHSNQNKHGNKQ